jgi:hypothetical protein
VTVKLGMFTMPFHHPDRDSATILEEDQEAIVPADRLDQLVALRDEVFGTLLMAGHDWDEPALWRRSMELLATDVMPKLERHSEATRA